jgi:zinc D-Ala-D-Ala carboxypeptidase
MMSLIALSVAACLLAGCADSSAPMDAAWGRISQAKAQPGLRTASGLEKPVYPNAVTADRMEVAADVMEVTDDWLLLVNKTHPLSKDYVPADMIRIKYCVGDHAESMRYMRELPAEHFHEMIEAAAAAGYEIGIRTAYRSYEQQYNIFWNYVARDGEEAANKYSARPGQSEHQTGLCADVTSPSVEYKLTTEYGQTPEGGWLAQNAHYYGFIIRYPLGKEDITGYQYEPWHVRYVGEAAATEIYEKELTLEEYLAIVD